MTATTDFQNWMFEGWIFGVLSMCAFGAFAWWMSRR